MKETSCPEDQQVNYNPPVQVTAKQGRWTTPCSSKLDMASNRRDQEIRPLIIAEQTKPNGSAVLGKASADLDRHLKGEEKNRRGRRPAAATQGKKQAGTFRKSIKSPQPSSEMTERGGKESQHGQLEGRPAKPPRRHQEPHGEGEMDGVEDALLELRLREREEESWS